MRILLRIAAVAAIVVFCGAAACGKHPTEIAYAPGYGYVVKVEQSMTHYQRDHTYYYVFPTEERAREFYGQYYSHPDWPDTLQPGERRIYDGSDEFDRIAKLLGPLPPPVNDLTMPLATPDLPQPIPQTPQ